MGGQIPNSLALKLANAGVPIIGTTPENIDKAEDRHKFSGLLDQLDVHQPEWKEFADLASAKQFANSVGYPVIVPSYVLSGAAMAVVHSEDDLKDFWKPQQNYPKKRRLLFPNSKSGPKKSSLTVWPKTANSFCMCWPSSTSKMPACIPATPYDCLAAAAREHRNAAQNQSDFQEDRCRTPDLGSVQYSAAGEE